MLWNAHIYFAAITHWSLRPFTSGVFSVTMGNSFASHTIMLFMLVPYLRCAHSYVSSNIPHALIIDSGSTMWVRILAHARQALIHTFFAMSSVILMLRTYAFSGRKTTVLVALSITLLTLVGVIIWVMSKHLARLSFMTFCSLRFIPDSSMKSQCLSYSWSNALAVSPFRTYRLSI